MSHFKAVFSALCMLSLLGAAAPAWAQDTDTDSADAPDSEAAIDSETTDTAAEEADTEETSEAASEAPSAAAITAPSAGILDAKQDAKQDAEAEAPVAESQISIEFAGPAAPGQPDARPSESSGDDTLQLKTPETLNPFIALGDEMFIGMSLITAWGIHFWDWFERSPHFEKEHGFTQESSTGGADKTGHFYTAYIFSDFLIWRLRRQGWSKLRSAIVGSSVAMGLMTWIEVGDSTSEYGWSWEDMLADFLGVAISAGLSLSPLADDLFDFRLEYWPTGSYLKGGVMAADYSGMKYLMAFRLSGIKPLKRTPLRLVELHMGYYSRGFRSFDNADNTNRVVYWGIGLDLKELFNKMIPNEKVRRPFEVAFTYYQPPYTSWTVHKWENKWTDPDAAAAATATANAPAAQ